MKLDTGSTRTFTITGKNIQYDSSVAKPNFTDVLGFFPVLVKARYSAAANNKLVVVAKATIHLQNSNQCFAISKDSFDFLASPAAIPFEIDDACQYTQIGDFFVPKATLSSFGFDLNYGANASLASVSFSPTLTVTGSALTSSYIEKITSNVDWSAETIYAKDILPSNVVSDPTGRPLSYYKNLSFDFNSLRDVDANITKLQFRWMDVNRMAVDGNTNPFGAAIEGNIILRYTDNTSAQVTPLRNFTTYPSLACTGTAPPTCEIGSEDLGAGMANPFHFTYALFYIDIAPHLGKGIKSIDMNLIGNKDANNLEIRLLPSVSFKSMVLGPPIVSPSNTTSNISMGGPYSILNLEGVNFLVKYLKDFGTLTPAAFSNSENPKFYVSSNNPNIAAWVENGLLKARYVGSDISSFNDGSIEMKISRTFGQGQNYGTITIEDYVDPRLGAGRTVSGAN